MRRIRIRQVERPAVDGKQLGKYQLQRLLGEGSMGVVYLAQQPFLDRPVAIKTIKRTLRHDPKAKERFEREIQIAGQMNHPSVVQAYDADVIAGRRILVMEHVVGVSFSTLIARRRRPTAAWMLEVLRQAAAGLQHIHEQGYLHGDLKPSNLFVADPLLSAPATLKILDFGLARRLETAVDPLAYRRAGTAEYIAPECIQPPGYADARSDIYSLGAAAFTLLAGRLPFLGASSTEIMLKRLTEDAPAIQELVPEISPRFADVLQRLLTRRPEDRWPTAAALLIELNRLIASK